jgi:SAM-dependent methyltransferase
MMLNQHTKPTLWMIEYNKQGIPSSFREEPSGSVLELYSFLSNYDIQHGQALDLGFGTGRNSIFLAEKGFEVHSIDFVAEMAERFKQVTQNIGMSEKIHVHCQSVTEKFPFQASIFDIAIDTFCYKHQVFDDKKQVYRRELARVMKPGSLFLLTLAGIDDGYYGPLLSKSPNPEQRIIVDPANNIASILYSKEDIQAEFSEAFQLVHYVHKQKDGMMHGKSYLRSTHLFIFCRL